MNRTLAAALTGLAVVWGLVILVAPVALAHPDTVRPATVVYAGASRICHQRAERSFLISGFQMPVCARCTGLYLSGALGALLGLALRITRPLDRTRMLLLLAALPTAGTFALEFLGIVAFSNGARALAAVPLGTAAGWLFVRMLRYDGRFDGVQDFHS